MSRRMSGTMEMMDSMAKKDSTVRRERMGKKGLMEREMNQQRATRVDLGVPNN